jgi:hypothetical protein
LEGIPLRKILFALFAGALAVVGMAVPAGAAPATHFTVNQQIPLAGFQVFVPCTGDTITFTQGTLHDMFSLTVNGSHFSLTTHDQPANLMGTDTSGRRYEGVGITRGSDSGSFVNGQAVSTFVNNFYMIGQAGAPSYKTHETFHVTFTPSGDITAFHDSLWITCR